MSIPTSTATQVKTKTVSATKFTVAIACLGLAALAAVAVNAEVAYPDKQMVIDQWDSFDKVASVKDKTVQNCGANWTCFLNAAAKCKKAKATFTYPAIDMGFFGFSIKVTNYNEIKGKLADGTCFMLQKNMKNVFSLSPWVKKEMIKQGASSSDMKKAEAQIKEMNTNKEMQKQMNVLSLCAAKSGKILSAELKDWKNGKMETKSSVSPGERFSVTQYPKRGMLCVAKQPCPVESFPVGMGNCWDELGSFELKDCYKIKSASENNGPVVIEYGGEEAEVEYNKTVQIGTHKFTNVGTEFVLAQCTINGVEKTGDDCGTQTQVSGGFNYAKLKVDCED